MQIKEATAREVMTRKEQLLKKKLIALLKNDGKGHKHVKYAERLEDFIIKIVDHVKDPTMTAAVSFEDATVYISSGFLLDPSTFYQLNVLMRHELAHYLMQHQIRMMHTLIKKYGETGYTHIKMSYSIHRLLNIIEDFEISNKRYTQEDKIVVKNMEKVFDDILGQHATKRNEILANSTMKTIIRGICFEENKELALTDTSQKAFIVPIKSVQQKQSNINSMSSNNDNSIL